MVRMRNGVVVSQGIEKVLSFSYQVSLGSQTLNTQLALTGVYE